MPGLSCHFHRRQAFRRVPPVVALLLLAALTLTALALGSLPASGAPSARQSSTAPAASLAASTLSANPAEAAAEPAAAAVETMVSIRLAGQEGWSETTRANVEAALELLPALVRLQLGNPALGPLYLGVNDEGRTLSGQQPYGRAANFYSTNENRNEIVLFPDQSVQTVLHEMGHAYNLRHVPAGAYGSVFLDPEMQSFLQAAGWRVLTPEAQLRTLTDHTQVKAVREGAAVWSRLSRDDPLEDFASSFALFFAAPQELERLSPARFDWFQRQFAYSAQH